MVFYTLSGILQDSLLISPNVTFFTLNFMNFWLHSFLLLGVVVAVVFCKFYSAKHDVWQRYPAFKREIIKWHNSTPNIFSCSHLNVSELFLPTQMTQVFILESRKKRSTKIMNWKVHIFSLFSCDVTNCIIWILSWTKSCHFCKVHLSI